MVLKKKWSKWGSKSYAQEEATWRKRKCNEKEAYYLWMEEGRAHNMLWGKLCSSNGKPTKRKTPSAKYVVNVKEKKKTERGKRIYPKIE